ncbi:MAG TPA: vWA domain-containing protein [Polyangia bacterium]|nr:vWA domain-containing protein [Polyangia bacterium]
MAASCTFNPGPAGSATGSTGQGYGGTGILGQANHTGTTGQSSGAAGSGSGTGTAAGNGSNPTPDGVNCGATQVGLQNVPPDLLIVLDKSGSMANDLNDMKCARGAACETKWADTTAAINMVVGQTDMTIRWGLKYFANNGTCGVTPGAAVPIGANNGAAIMASIAMTNPGSSTPTRLAVQSGADYLMTVMDPNPKYILLATDGEPNCAPGQANDADDSAGAVAAVMAAATAGIPVFVVGVGNVAPAIATLNMLADAGGRPQAGATHYYPVGSTADLVKVLGTIGDMIASCSFGLGQAPPVPNNVGVYGNGEASMKIPRDTTHMNGWDYGAGMTSIVLYGAACDSVKNKTYKTVQAIYGCPGMIIP